MTCKDCIRTSPVSCAAPTLACLSKTGPFKGWYVEPDTKACKDFVWRSQASVATTIN